MNELFEIVLVALCCPLVLPLIVDKYISGKEKE